MTLTSEETQRLIAESDRMRAEYFEKNPVDRVGYDKLGGGALVSTVKLRGYDNWPTPFETMVFDYGDGCFQWQYATREAALAGHVAVLAQAKARTLREDFDPRPIVV